MFLSVYQLCGFSSRLSPELVILLLSQVFMSEKEYNAKIVGRKLHYSQAHLLIFTLKFLWWKPFCQIVECVCMYALRFGGCFILAIVSFSTQQHDLNLIYVRNWLC